jgi:hypothetical protein
LYLCSVTENISTEGLNSHRYETDENLYFCSVTENISTEGSDAIRCEAV